MAPGIPLHQFDDSDDDDLQLSSDTLAALQSFMSEREEAKKRFDELQAVAEQQRRLVTMDAFEEDWQHSQFWYHDDTATRLAYALLEGTKPGDTIACVSAPTLFVKLRELRAEGKMDSSITIRLLEYDRRFAVLGDEYVFYDYTTPLKGLPAELQGRCDRVFADPPFLNENCQTKTAMTVRWLTRPWTPNGDDTKIMVCTGERMRRIMMRVYKSAGLRVTGFEVKHQNVLANPFLCYSSFETKEVKWLGEDELGDDESDVEEEKEEA